MVVRKVELQPGENRVLEVKLRAEGTASQVGHAAKAGGPPKALLDAMAEFEKLMSVRAYRDARQLALRTSRQPDYRDVREQLVAAANAASVLEERAAAIREAAEALLGSLVTLQTKSGPKTGSVKEVSEAGVTLEVELKIGGRVAGTSRLLVVWRKLTTEQESKLAKAWRASGPTADLAMALLALARHELPPARDDLPVTAQTAALAPYVAWRSERLKRSLAPEPAASPVPPRKRKRRERKWPPGLKVVRALFRGRIVKYVPETLTLVILYDFSDRAQRPDWSFSEWAHGLGGSRGKFDVHGGALHVGTSGRCLLLKGRFSSVSMSADVSARAGRGSVSLVVCADDAGNFYRTAALISWHDCALYRCVSGRVVGVTPERPSPLAGSKGGSASVSYRDGLLTGQIEGVTLSEQVDGPGVGQVGFWAPNTEATFDNVRVTGVLDAEWLKQVLGIRQ